MITAAVVNFDTEIAVVSQLWFKAIGQACCQSSRIISQDTE